jgi:Mg2+ and Co2+ transporter CorA
MPLTFITGLYGMNVNLPHFGLSDTFVFWVLLVTMLSVVGSMIFFFRRRGWI